MADNPKCQECEDLKAASREARRYASNYRPFLHSGRRPPSRWCQDDRNAKDQAEKAANLCQAKYQLHFATHLGDSANPREVEKNFSIVLRGGRLRP